MMTVFMVIMKAQKKFEQKKHGVPTPHVPIGEMLMFTIIISKIFPNGNSIISLICIILWSYIAYRSMVLLLENSVKYYAKKQLICQYKNS